MEAVLQVLRDAGPAYRYRLTMVEQNTGLAWKYLGNFQKRKQQANDSNRQARNEHICILPLMPHSVRMRHTPLFYNWLMDSFTPPMF